MPQETSSTGKNSVVETIDPATAKPAELRKAVDGNPNLSEEFIKSTLNESRRNLTNTERQNDEVWFGYNKDFYDKYMPSLRFYRHNTAEMSLRSLIISLGVRCGLSGKEFLPENRAEASGAVIRLDTYKTVRIELY